MTARKIKRPPVAWDGIKPLKMKWALYVHGEVVNNIIAYNIKERWLLTALDNEVVHTMLDVPILVKRLD